MEINHAIGPFTAEGHYSHFHYHHVWRFSYDGRSRWEIGNLGSHGKHHLLWIRVCDPFNLIYHTLLIHYYYR